MAATKKKEKKNAMAVINQHIKTGEFAKIYLLYGEERYLVNLYSFATVSESDAPSNV